MSEDSLDGLRVEIDAIDDELVDLLARRQALVARVADVKARTNLPLRDVLREARQVARLAERARSAGLDELFVARVIREVIDHSVRVQETRLGIRELPEPQRPVTVLFQGSDGAFSHIAGRRFFGPRGWDVKYRGVATFRTMLEEVRAGTADYAMLPIENTTSGSVHDAYDALSHTDLAIIGEEILRIEMCLIGVADVPLADSEDLFASAGALAVHGVPRVAAAGDRRDVHRHGDERRAHQGGERPDARGDCERRGGGAARAARAAPRHREPQGELHALPRDRT